MLNIHHEYYVGKIWIWSHIVNRVFHNNIMAGIYRRKCDRSQTHLSTNPCVRCSKPEVPWKNNEKKYQKVPSTWRLWWYQQSQMGIMHRLVWTQVLSISPILNNECIRGPVLTAPIFYPSHPCSGVLVTQAHLYAKKWIKIIINL